MKTGRDREFSFLKRWLGSVAALGLITSALTSHSQPINDSFANRILIPGGSTNFSGNLSNATSEVNEPYFTGISSGQTAWWTWIAPSNGILDFVISGNGFHPFVTVYSGESLEALSLTASNNYLACYSSTGCGCHWRTRSHINFHVAQGQAYQFNVDSLLLTDASWILENSASYFVFSSFHVIQTTNIVPGDAFQVEIEFTPAPANDDFENRVMLSGSRRQLLVSNRGATQQLGEPHSSTNSGGSSVWYSWTAPNSGRVSLSTNNIPPYAPPSWQGSVLSWQGSVVYYVQPVNWVPSCGNEIDQTPPPQFFPLLAAYTGTTLNSLTSASVLPLSIEAFPHAVAFDVIKGRTYQIAVDGNQGTTGDFPLFLALTRPASNDDFDHRIATHGAYVIGTGFNAGATHEAGEPASPSNSFGKSVWWSWRAPVSGNVSIHLSNSDYAFPIAVFAGNKLSRLNLLSSGTGFLSFEAMAGETYSIAVSDLDGLTGAFNFQLQAPMVEAEFTGARRSGSRLLFQYKALKGQVLLFQGFDGSDWHNLGAEVAHDSGVSFTLNAHNTQPGMTYRAIIIDWLR